MANNFIFVTPQVLIARNAAALYGIKVGSANMPIYAVMVGTAPDSLLNSVYAQSIGAASTATVADVLIANLGITGTSAIDIAKNFIVAQLNGAAVTARGAIVNSILDGFSKLTADATFGAAATAWNTKIADAVSYAATPGNADAVFGTTEFTLAVGLDNVVGTAGDDIFLARTINNGNTLQDGDKVDGGAGNDTLIADVTDYSNAISPDLKNIESVVIRAQTTTFDVKNGNNQINSTVQIDAQRSLAVDSFNTVTAGLGVTRWESNNSRSDVIIEDVRIGNAQKTSDVTIAMVETDPGNVDLGVYFDQHSLRNAATGNTTLTINLMDTGAAGAAATAATPLLNNPYDLFKLGINGVLTSIQLDKTAVAAADTYEALLTVFQAALASSGGATATLGASFTITDPISNTSVTGKSIVLTGGQGIAISAPAGSGWFNTTGASVPPTSNIYTTFTDAATSVSELVTSKVILDDVGRGSTGGDLVIGGMSIGETSTSRGVERFEIEVRDNSKLQTINSTNNALREVTITNGATSKTVANAYTKTVTDEGDLTVNGTNFGTDATITVVDANLAGVNNYNRAGNTGGATVVNHSGAGAAGFTDVRLIDASAFKGKLAFTAAITSDAIPKYITAVDTAANPAADVAGTGNVNFDVKGANFVYTGGNDNDTMVVTIDSTVAASRSSIVSGQSDFTFAIDGGAGDDAITVNVAGGVLTGGAQNWYNNQNLNDNITINGGAGNDVIRTPGAGDTKIDAGAGNDVIYTDNTGVQVLAVTAGSPTTVPSGQAIWVFNTTDQITAVPLSVARDINNLRSDISDTYNLYKGTLTVTYKGLPSVAVSLANATTFQTTDLEINQAIKNAINTDPTLKNLLVARDGPANSLVVESLIDGVQVATDLSVTVAAPVATTTFSIAEIAAIATAYGNAAITTSALALAAMTASVAAYTTKGDYVSALATDAATASITGANSISTSDNFITPGAGNDIIVLGTTEGANVNLSSNEVVTFAAGFGNDVIVHFNNGLGVAPATTVSGIDHLNFNAFLGTGTAAAAPAYATATNGQIAIVGQVAATNGTAALVQTLVVTADAAVTTAATNQVMVVVDAHNVGSVYSVTNGLLVGDAVATLQGTIDLADTAWASLTTANFTVPSATAEALGAGVVVGPVIPGGATTTAISGALLTGTGTAGADTFNIATGAYAATIAGFGQAGADNLAFFAGAAITVVPDANQADGIQVLTAADAVTGATTTITLTGLTATQDLNVFNTPSFLATFGAGSIA